MLQLNGAKWRKKRLGENRKDWILGAPVCPSLRFSGWILNEESSLSLSPWHRGWSHSWHSGVLTEVALWGVYSCRSTGRGHLYYCCFPARRYLPPSNSHPMLGLGLILQKFPDLKETAERLIQSLPFMREERSVDTFVNCFRTVESEILFLGQGKSLWASNIQNGTSATMCVCVYRVLRTLGGGLFNILILSL